MESLKTADPDDTTGAGWDNGDLTEEEVMALQKALGVTPDGKYGAISKEAALGLDARTAYDLFVLKGQATDEPVVSWGSVMNLGYGPISAEELDRLIQAGEVKEVVDGNTIRFEKVEKPSIGPQYAPTLTNKYRNFTNPLQ